MNRAALKLRQILEEKGRRSHTELAQELGVGLDVVSKWLADKHRPSAPYRARMQELHGIDILAWDESVDSGRAEVA